MHIDVVDVHGANGICDGHERSFTPLASEVSTNASYAYHVHMWRAQDQPIGVASTTGRT